MYEHPGTNKYYSAENPLYGREIKQAVIDDDKASHNSLDVNAVDGTNSGHILSPNQKASAPLPPPPDEEQEVVLQISELAPDANHTSPSPLANGTTGAENSQPGTRGDNHTATLDQVLQAYSNSAFEDDEDDTVADDTENDDAQNQSSLKRETENNTLNEQKNANKTVKNSHNVGKPLARIPTTNSAQGGHSGRPVSGSGAGLYIPGVGEDVQEGVTRFTDESPASDSSLSEGVQANSSHLNYTDI
ncbi:hypothetical protein PoB_000128000 [Plakobranchus ocellatus]|uniref:Uncharacterized protein n=1 Tax=Plakobranchus ocellatus TaxID=259542 RepID=A0AAV3XVY5_9GAST|nr:hypothetical protein PoB_000128000 [Plakobranchus ocellatus]